ncbi:MAG: hypothetical protein M0C28_00050 [Candidatus Moduliflexus flocculans]|nr:hypothetical protein [Candidatus Moduliflexus flocculans]
MADICLRHDLKLLVSDEIHADIVYAPNRHLPIATLSPEIASRTITCMAPSKTFNIAGLASSLHAIIPDEERRAVFKAFLHDNLDLSVNVFGITAMEAASPPRGPVAGRPAGRAFREPGVRGTGSCADRSPA